MRMRDNGELDRNSERAPISVVVAKKLGIWGCYDGYKNYCRFCVFAGSQPERKIRNHLRKLGFTRGAEGSLVSPASSKDSIRILHLERRKARLKQQRRFVQSTLPRLLNYFANGSEVVPDAISPRLELIKAHTWQSDLFRLASLSWSVPVSAGFGRRLRYLVWDDLNKKLIGIIALGDPVFNLKVRDELIGWSSAEREKRLVNVMDAYVLGAVPLYNFLLGGKLVTALVRTKEVGTILPKGMVTLAELSPRKRRTHNWRW